MKSTRPIAGFSPAVRLLTLLSVPLSVFCLDSALAAPEPVASTLTAATIYTDRAVVTRTAALDLTAGEHELSFENLPAALVDDSLQVTAHGAAQATILDVNARNTFLEATPDDRVKGLEDQLKELARQQRKLDDQSAVLVQQRDLLLKIQTAATTPVSGPRDPSPPSVDDWAKLLDFTDGGLGRLAEAQRALDVQREDLQAKQSALELQLNQLRGAATNRSRNVQTVTIRVAVATAGQLQLALAYAVRGAAWSPAYDARLHAEDQAVDLSYFGVIRQNTGEDWKGVQLTLSTARPSLGGGAPELNAWVLDQRPPPRPVARMAATTAARRGGAGGGGGGGAGGGRGGRGGGGGGAAGSTFGIDGVPAAAPALADVQAAFSSAAVESGVTSASYRIPVASTVLSDNTPQKVGIASVRLAATLQDESTPRLLEAAFLSASVKNTSEVPFLAGPMNTFLDDAFIATSSLKTVMPAEKFALTLGADEGLAVKRRLVNRLTEQTGLTGKYTRITYEYLVTVTNNKRTLSHLVFREPLPLSRNEKIVVKLDTPAEREVGTPDKPGREVTREEGSQLVWRVDLKPGEKREIPLKFSVEYPNDLAVTGLE